MPQIITVMLVDDDPNTLAFEKILAGDLFWDPLVYYHKVYSD